MKKVKENVKMQKERNQLNLDMKETRGITLIALVITIIVMLILAGVTIATLTGENGILTQAEKAKTETQNANLEEQVKLAFLGSYGTDGELDYSKLTKNLKNIEKMEGVIDSITEGSFPLTVTVNGEEIKIFKDGTIFNSGEWDKTASGEDCFYWESDDPDSGEAYHTIVGYADSLTNETKLKIPSRCYKITCDKINWYNQGRTFAKTFSKVELPETIVEIGYHAFSYFQLTNITIPESVTIIGESAFEGCKMSTVTVPNSVIKIEASAFQDCKSLSSITIPNSITSIGAMAFGRCTNLSNITIPDSVTSIGVNALVDWTSSQTINIQGYTSAPPGWNTIWNDGCSAKINWGQ